jgi:hypothetical protein
MFYRVFIAVCVRILNDFVVIHFSGQSAFKVFLGICFGGVEVTVLVETDPSVDEEILSWTAWIVSQ